MHVVRDTAVKRAVPGPERRSLAPALVMPVRCTRMELEFSPSVRPSVSIVGILIRSFMALAGVGLALSVVAHVASLASARSRAIGWSSTRGHSRCCIQCRVEPIFSSEGAARTSTQSRSPMSSARSAENVSAIRVTSSQTSAPTLPPVAAFT